MTDTTSPPAAGTVPADGGVRPGQRLGSLIGAIFGLVYVEANSGSLPHPWAPLLRIAGGCALAGLAALLALAPRRRGAPGAPGSSGFSGGFWLVVAGEAAAIVAGANVLSGPAGLPRAVVAWVSVVVGVHFVVLARIWRLRFVRYLGAAIAACGAAALSAAAAGASAALIASVGGVLPGGLLLAAAYAGAIGPVRARVSGRRPAAPG